MKNGLKVISRLIFCCLFLMSFIACNSEEFFEKDLQDLSISENPPTPEDPGEDDNNKEYKLVSDTFLQDESSRGVVDVMWVVDNSASMDDVQQSLAQNFGFFIREFVSQDLDFQMGITSTDPLDTPDGDGRMVGGSHLHLLNTAAYNASPNDFFTNFENLIRVGTSGHHEEKGLNASKRFIERYQSSFLRDNAQLAIIYVSDEEDQSNGSAISDYSNYFKSLKANDGDFKAYSIVTKFDTGNEWDTIGNRYLALSSDTQGLSAHVQGDFADILSNIGERIVELSKSFPLKNTPYDLNNFEVLVNGVKVTEGWVYDETTKSIQFEIDSIPAEGSEITINYFTKI